MAPLSILLAFSRLSCRAKIPSPGCRESSAPTPSSICYRRLRAGEVDDEFESVTTCNLIVMELCRMGNLRQALNKGLLHKQVGPGRLTVRMELLLLVGSRVCVPVQAAGCSAMLCSNV